MLHFVIFYIALLQACFIFAPKTVENCQKRDREGCFDCMTEVNPEGYRAYQEYILESCYCGFECFDTCEDFCASQDTPDNSCGECFQAVSDDPLSICLSDFLDECVEDDDCMMFISSLNKCEADQSAP